MTANAPIAEVSPPMIVGLKRLLSHLSRRRRWQAAWLLAAMIIGAIAELATLGAVMPFLALLANPTLAPNFPLLQKLLGVVAWKGDNTILPAIMLFAVVALSAAAIRMLVAWASAKWIFGVAADIGMEVYRRTLYQPYSFHVSRNTSQIIAGLNKVQTMAFDVINPLVQSTMALVISIAILSALILIDPVTAGVAGLGFAALYLLVTRVTGRTLRANGKTIAENETRRVQAVQEGLGAIRDVLIDGTQDIYVRRFWEFDSAYRRAQAANNFVGGSPRYLIESMGMVFIAFLAFWLSLRMGGLSAAIPALGALAMGAQKLFPQMQQIYYGWAGLSGSSTALAEVTSMLELPIPEEYLRRCPVGRTRLEQGVALCNVSFRYREDAPDVVAGLSLDIPRGSRVGFVGKTGSGKSTVLDLIMGLLEPTKGRIEIDGKLLTRDNRREWQARIAHVPQAIYLTDATIAENIAFGLNAPDIDQARVREAADKAQLADFIETLPAQYDTQVGERGVRLSGGQRQRIGLARALYKNADVLVLDEATSALDEGTESAVMEAINSLGEDTTVLMVAHRTSTLRNCDRIFELKNGRLFREGAYEQITRGEDAAPESSKSTSWVIDE